MDWGNVCQGSFRIWRLYPLKWELNFAWGLLVLLANSPEHRCACPPYLRLWRKEGSGILWCIDTPLQPHYSFAPPLKRGTNLGVHFAFFEPVFYCFSKVSQVEWFGYESIGTVTA